MTIKQFKRLQLLATAMPLALAQQALAQTATAPIADEEHESASTIVVTAKNREERLQDVPLAITTFNASELKDRGALDVRDIAAFTPSFNFYSGTGRSDPTALAVRGLAPNTSDERYQGLSMFIDGIALSGQLVGVDLSQVERVEVIKGPQSATFGRATYSGAVNYITANPSGDRIGGYVRLRGSVPQGSEGDTNAGYYIGGRIDLPVIRDTLWISVDGLSERTGRLFRGPGQGRPIGEEKTTAYGGTIFAELAPGLTVKLRGNVSNEDDSTAAVYNIHPREFGGAGNTVALPRGPLALWPVRVPDTVLGITSGGVVAASEPADGGRTRRREFASLIVEYALGPGYQLTYRGGYNYQFNKINEDFYFRSLLPGADPVFGPAVASVPPTATVTPSPTAFLSSTSERFRNQSHQFIVISPGDKAFKWQAGLYYFYESDLNFDFANRRATNPTGQSRGVEAIENKAVFAGASLDVTEALTLSLEGRYQVERQTVAACTFCQLVTPVGLENKDSAFLPRLTVDYKITSDNLLYALYARGEKSSRHTTVATDLNANGTITEDEVNFFIARPEKLDNFEAGLKNSFDGGRSLLNIAAFYQKISDQQLITQEPVQRANGTTAIVSGVRSAGGSRIWGFEVEGRLRVTEALTLSGNVGYADQKFTSTTPILIGSGSAVFFPDTRGDGTVVLDGRSQANVPRWTGSVSAAYVQPIGSSGAKLNLRADASYRGPFFGDLGNISTVPGSWKVNLRAALTTGSLEIAGFVRNLFNDRTATGAFLGGGAYTCSFRETNTAVYGAGASQRCFFAGVPRPREIGLEATFNF